MKTLLLGLRFALPLQRTSRFPKPLLRHHLREMFDVSPFTIYNYVNRC